MGKSDAVAARFTLALSTYEEHARVQREAADRLTAQLLRLRPSFGRVFEVGCGTGRWSRTLAVRSQIDALWLNDLSPELAVEARKRLPETVRKKTVLLPGDAELLAWPDGLDLVLAGSVLQWFSKPEAFFENLRRRLRPGGLAAVVTYGPENCREVKALTGQGLAYPDAAELFRLASAFRLHHRSEDVRRECFASPRAVLRHLRATGVTGTHGGFRWTKESLLAFEEAYRTRFAARGPAKGVHLTYHPVTMLLEKTS